MNRLIFTAAVIILSFSTLTAEARRHRKFKGVIVVNQILKLEGTITNNKNPAPEYSGVKQGDLLETGDKSAAVIRIPGLAIFKMDANTRFHLTSFSNRDESRFEVEKGTVLAVFRRAGHHVFKLSKGVLTLHGTTFLSRVTGDGDEVCLCDGKLAVQLKNEKRATASVTPSPSPYTGPVISAEPERGASPKLELKASPAPTPTAAPTPVKEIEISSSNEHKQFLISDEGIVVKGLKLLDVHSSREIQELQSLYDLP